MTYQNVGTEISEALTKQSGGESGDRVPVNHEAKQPSQVRDAIAEPDPANPDISSSGPF